MRDYHLIDKPVFHSEYLLISDKDMENVKNSVKAIVFNVAVPFIGVDDESICEKLYKKSGEKANCPVKAGETYIYKDSFPILDFYPNINTKVTWSLKGDDDTFLSCFHVRATIN